MYNQLRSKSYGQPVYIRKGSWRSEYIRDRYFEPLKWIIELSLWFNIVFRMGIPSCENKDKIQRTTHCKNGRNTAKNALKKWRYLQVPMKIPSLANEDAFRRHRSYLPKNSLISDSAIPIPFSHPFSAECVRKGCRSHSGGNLRVDEICYTFP